MFQLSYPVHMRKSMKFYTTQNHWEKQLLLSLLWMPLTTHSRQTFLFVARWSEYLLYNTIAAIAQGIHRAGADHPEPLDRLGEGSRGWKGPITGWQASIIVKALM